MDSIPDNSKWLPEGKMGGGGSASQNLNVMLKNLGFILYILKNQGKF